MGETPTPQQERVKALIGRALERREDFAATIGKRVVECEKMSEIAHKLKGDAASLTQSFPLSRSSNEPCFEPVAEKTDTYRKTLSSLKNRLNKDCLKLGMCGYAKAGKSTALRTITGLGEEIIPSESLYPTTASRATYYNRSGPPSATVFFHSEFSFMEAHLLPLYTSLGIESPPVDIEEFASAELEDLGRAIQKKRQLSSSDTADLAKLKTLQKALPSIRPLLSGSSETITDTDALGTYLAYPSYEKIVAAGEEIPRPYLAVREAHVYSTFPYAYVSSLAMVDAPGLGEHGSSPKEIMRVGLEAVDHIIFVVRAEKGKAYIGQADISVAGLIDEAQQLVRDRRNFVTIVINYDEADPLPAEAMFREVTAVLNNGEPDSRFRVVMADVRSQDNVNTNVLAPILETIANSLGQIDDDLLQTADELGVDALTTLKAEMNKLEAYVDKARQISSMEERELNKRCRALKGDYSASLGQAQKEQYITAYNVEPTEQNIRSHNAVDAIKEKVDDDITSGNLWMGETWELTASRRISTDRSGEGFMLEQLNHVRTAIAGCYEELNQLYQKRLDDFFRVIVAAFMTNTGTLISQNEGLETINNLIRSIEESGRPMPILLQALEWLASLRFDFRQHVYPGIRKALNIIDPASGHHQGRLRDLEGYSMDELPARIKAILQRDAQAANSAVCEAIKNNVTVIEEFLFAGLEHYSDQIIRAEGAEDDFYELGRLFKAELWPEHYARRHEETSRLDKIERNLRSAQSWVASFTTL